MEQEFYELILNNLKTNGFPEKKVSLPLEKLYEAADNKNLNLNKILEKIESEGVVVEKTLDKIIFSSQPLPDQNKVNDMQKKAMDMMKGMDPKELEAIKKQFDEMDSTQREELMKKAKEMGML